MRKNTVLSVNQAGLYCQVSPQTIVNWINTCKFTVLSVNQAGLYCQVSPQTIVNWINTRKLKAYKTAGGHRRIVKSDLIEFLKQHNMPAFESSSYPFEGKRARKIKVLVVNDDPVIVQSLTACLEEGPHEYEVTSTSMASGPGSR
jgi:excisionase family DNA binding protein